MNRPAAHIKSLLFFLGVFFLVMSPRPCRAQESDVILSQIHAAFEKGSIQELSRHMPPSVEIAMFGAARFYSKGQASLLMKQFFEDYPPAGFAINDFTKTTNGWFMEADITVKESKRRIRAYIRLRKDRSGWKIREILIENPDD